MKIKIIDLLNMISKGEELPKKIKWNNHIWTLKYKEHSYYKYNYDNEQGKMIEEWLVLDCLNDEVEVIEDIPKKIEKILEDEFADLTKEAKLWKLYYKYNEIIDYINNMEE